MFLYLGITFKENCPDIRNSKVIDIIKELKEFGCNVDVYDPWADAEEVTKEYGIELISKKELSAKKYSGAALAVSHTQFKDFNFSDMKKNGTVFYDVKGLIDRKICDARL